MQVSRAVSDVSEFIDSGYATCEMSDAPQVGASLPGHGQVPAITAPMSAGW
jgi:hypothetical protein